jgi:hypothetical protein
MGSVGNTLGRVALGTATGGLSELLYFQPKAMADIQNQQEKFAKEQEDALKAQPVKEDPMESYGADLQSRLRRLRAGFSQNLKTSPVGLLAPANTKTPSLEAGTKYLGG